MNTAKQRETFISYSRKDKEFALEFAREMKSAGYLVWLDQLDIPTGARWDDEVEKALRECKIFLIILTTASVSSDNVKDEIGYAIDHGKRIMPVLLEKCDVPLRLRRFQYVDFTKVEFNEGIKRAKQLLETLITERSTPLVTINPGLEPQKVPNTETTHAPTLPNKNKPTQLRWVGYATGILLLATCLGVLATIFLLRNVIFPQANQIQPQISPVATSTEKAIPTNTNIPPTELTPTEPPPTETLPPTVTPPPTLTPTPSVTPTKALPRVEFLITAVDDRAEVVLNSSAPVVLNFGAQADWTDMSGYVARGTNIFTLTLWNEGGPCQMEFAVRIDGQVRDDLKWSYLNRAPAPSQMNGVCESVTRTFYVE